ncbi:MAG: hypothetical protein AAB016_08365, partial [candidate division NC10 bacterium]
VVTPWLTPSATRGFARLGEGCLRLFLVATLLVATGCASVAPLETATREPVSAPVFRFGEDTFAFPNEVRSLNPGREDLYANYCFVMTRGVVQFLKFARFDPSGAKLPPDAYAELVRQVASRSPWEEALPPEERVVIPGYRNLQELSLGEAVPVKAGLGSRFWTMVHWTNWRVTFPVGGAHQEGVAAEVLAELRAGRPVQLLITNWPTPELNHGVVAYGYRISDGAVEFSVYDPNEPGRPGVISFERQPRRFWATQLFDTKPGPIRAFRMYYSPLL